jgi:hypothetical protein
MKCLLYDNGVDMCDPNDIRIMPKLVYNSKKKSKLQSTIETIWYTICHYLGKHAKVNFSNDSNKHGSSTTNPMKILSTVESISEHYGMPLPNEVNSCGSPVDPYRKTFNPAVGWY